MENMQPAAPYTKPCILQVAVERACGLKTAAELLASQKYSSDEMKCNADVGLNCYATISPSFLPDQVIVHHDMTYIDLIHSRTHFILISSIIF